MSRPEPAEAATNGRKRPLIDTAELFQHPIQRALWGLFKPGLEALFSIDRTNAIYAACQGITDPGEFCEQAYREIGIHFELPEADLARLREVEGPLVLVANHPFGGLEALMLIILMRRIRQDFRVMANYMLEGIAELRPSFIFVDPFGEEKSRQSNIGPLKQALGYLKGGGFLGVFPSGEVAAFNPKSRKVQEPEWSPNITRLIQKTGASVVPIYFHGHNSLLFHLASIISPKLRLSLLPREFARPTSRKIEFQIGSLITPEKIATYPDPVTLTAYLKSKTYILSSRYRQSKIRFDMVKALTGPDAAHTAGGAPATEYDEIIAPVPKAELAAEIAGLAPEDLLFEQKEMQVYVFEGNRCPALLRELGRLREVTFRGVGEGCGKCIDTDRFDDLYSHIFIWQKDEQEIIGAYRVGRADRILAEQGPQGLYTNTLFQIQPALWKQINPALELGRSFVRAEYQRNYWSLLLLWTGIGRFVVREPHYHSLIGPVTISGEFHDTSKDIMVRFLQENTMSSELKDYVRPRNPYPYSGKHISFYNSFSIKNLNDVQDLISEIETTDLRVPILIKHYLKMGGNILAFNVDPDFSNVLDGLMYIDLRKTDTSILRKYMGEEGFTAYARTHGLAAGK